ncbi:MAG TPA: M57 family metalloprotease [Chitinophagaceae bacterium]|nr:M57 family metalloprotease [Chitinophagaceae bacterium]
MRRLVKPLSAILIVAVLSILIYSCKKETKQEPQQEAISSQVLDKIAALGFSKNNVQKHEEGYLIEGDIVLTENDLNNSPEVHFLRIAETEQYRTNNLVGSLPRTITVRVSTTLPSAYVTATNEAIRRYNAENLRITFQRVTSGGNIVITRAPSGAGYLASAGFPSGGNPYSSVRVNSSYLGSNPGTNYLATILAHEMGHCIGFRHSDFMNRAYSCGGSPVNEGASTVGAVHIPGTPTGPASGSWMLACIGSGQNRPFNTSDRTALNYLY